MPKAETYILQVGSKELGEKRLEIINEIYNPYSKIFLENIGLRSGMRVLDIGCGTGIMACWIAEQVGSKGKVVGLDISSEQLEIARKHADQLHLKQTEFFEKNIYDINKELGEFDIVYSRFVFMHLTEPLRALQLAKAVVKKGGILAIEDGDVFTIFSHPEHPALLKCLAWYKKLDELKKLSLSKASSLYTMFRKNGLKNVHCEIVHPLFQGIKQRSHMAMIVLETKAGFMQLGVTENEVDSVAKELYEMAEDEDYLMAHMRSFQVHGIVE